jgi:hypothetical protein
MNTELAVPVRPFTPREALLPDTQPGPAGPASRTLPFKPGGPVDICAELARHQVSEEGPHPRPGCLH